MTEIETLKRRVLLKKQLIEWTQGDIKVMEEEIAELEAKIEQEREG